MYLVVKAKYTKALLSKKSFYTWFLILLLWPFVTIIYAPSLDMRALGLLLYYYTFFIGTVVYTIANGLPSIYKMLSASLMITLIGMILSMAFPEFFEQVAALAGGRTYFAERAFGFFLQPNILSISFVLMFLGWFALWNHKNSSSETLVLLFFLAFVLLTGSRTGILIAAIFIFLIKAYGLKQPFISIKNILKMFAFIVLFFLFFAVAQESVQILGQRPNRIAGDLIDRVETVLDFRLTRGALVQDISAHERTVAQQVYFGLISAKPIWGHGFGSDSFYKSTARIHLSAHSSVLTNAMEYGVLYPLVLILSMFAMFRKSKKFAVEKKLNTNTVTQFVITFLILYIYSSIMDNRTFYVIFGLLYSVVYFPKLLDIYDHKTNSTKTLQEGRTNMVS
jgi:O-antigen ligase